jgi:hypothetical protein
VIITRDEALNRMFFADENKAYVEEQKKAFIDK